MSGEKTAIRAFYATCGKNGFVQGLWQKILIICKAQELSMNVYHKTNSNVSRKVQQAQKQAKVKEAYCGRRDFA